MYLDVLLKIIKLSIKISFQFLALSNNWNWETKRDIDNN